MLSFDAALFAWMGLAAAAGPLLIHLLNRRRFRTVSWAAMEFLQEALSRNRRFMNLRDLLLLLLRILAVICFAAALARPFYTGSAGAALGQGVLAVVAVLALVVSLASIVVSRSRRGIAMTVAAVSVAGLIGLWRPWAGASTVDIASRANHIQDPVHVAVVIDNSRSMGLSDGQQTLLQAAQQRARELVRQLPPESRVTVIPAAGSTHSVTLDAFRNREDAIQAIDQVRVCDTSDHPGPVIELLEQALTRVRELPTKRVVWLSDFQSAQWLQDDLANRMRSLHDVQLVPVTQAALQNLYVESLELDDGVASVETAAHFTVRVAAAGSPAVIVSPSAGTANSGESLVQVRLLIDGQEVATQSIELTEGQTRTLEFTHQFTGAIDPDQPQEVVATVQLQCSNLTADRLPADNTLSRIVPVVAALPVVFVDQYGTDENIAQNRLGESYALRHLLAPRSTSELDPRALIQVERATVDDLSPQRLASARLVVMAGVPRPGAAVDVLREYVIQGGRLVILAGGGFDPVGWMQDAWRDGEGILPVPLLDEPLGVEPEHATGPIEPFYIAGQGLQHPYFVPPGEDPELLRSLFAATPIFKAVQADLKPDVLLQLQDRDAKSIEQFRTLRRDVAALKERSQSPGTVLASPDLTRQLARLTELEQQLRRQNPQWWRLKGDSSPWNSDLSVTAVATSQQPRVLARYTRGDVPFAVERQVGAGEIVLFTTGVTSNWNLFRSSSAMYIFHRTFCQLMEETLPPRNVSAGERLLFPLQDSSPGRILVRAPDDTRRPASIEPLPSGGVAAAGGRGLLAGVYQFTSEHEGSGGGTTLDGSAAANAATGNTSSGNTAIPQPSPDDVLLTAAVVADAAESQIAPLNLRSLRSHLEQEHLRVLAPGESIHLEGVVERGRGLWKLLALLAGLCLLGEMALLASQSTSLTGESVNKAAAAGRRGPGTQPLGAAV